MPPRGMLSDFRHERNVSVCPLEGCYRTIHIEGKTDMQKEKDDAGIQALSGKPLNAFLLAYGSLYFVHAEG